MEQKVTEQLWDSLLAEDRYRILGSLYYFDCLLTPAPFHKASNLKFADLDPTVQAIIKTHGSHKS